VYILVELSSILQLKSVDRLQEDVYPRLNSAPNGRINLNALQTHFWWPNPSAIMTVPCELQETDSCALVSCNELGPAK
jgi:hypothetical protein